MIIKKSASHIAREVEVGVKTKAKNKRLGGMDEVCVPQSKLAVGEWLAALGFQARGQGAKGPSWA